MLLANMHGKDEKGIKMTNACQKVLDDSNRKPRKI